MKNNVEVSLIMGINSLNNIKFIGVGVKGIDIVNKLSHDNKKYINPFF